jgi:signal-transduction protein with cAMP-binding, CBS, and nucleotidyltransferase domain
MNEQIEELQYCNELTYNCRTCKNTHDIYYEPGVTMIQCDCKIMVVLPDWNPRGVLRIWNALNAQSKRSPEIVNEITKQFIERQRKNGEKSRMDTATSSTTRPPALGGV